jgi:preprotein translocase subunit SecA
VNEFHGLSDFDGFQLELIRSFSMESPVNEAEFLKLQPVDITEKVYHSALENYRLKSEHIAERSFPIVKDVYENQNSTFENIVTPFTDGIRTLQVLVNLKRAFETKGHELVLGMEKGVILALIDDAWKEHLREMDDLKQSVQHAVYEQKDPLLIYKFESFELFKQMMARNNKDIASFLTKANLPNEQENQVQQARVPQQQPQQKLQTSRTEVSAATQQQQPEKQKVEQVVRQEPKTGRNDPCPCGSGKKYKSCHGK